MGGTAEGETAGQPSDASRLATHALAKRLMLNYIVTERRNQKRIRLEPPIDATCVTVDGTSNVSCRVVEISNSGAQLECPILLPNATEFFLLFTTSLNPVFRRCQRVWVRGRYTGVKFLPRGRRATYEPEDRQD